MRNNLTAPPGLKVRLAIGITAAGVLAGGGLAAAAMTGATATADGPASTAAQTSATRAQTTSTQAQAVAGNQELAALQQVAGTRRVPLSRIRALGGMYGSFTFRTKAGDRTLAFERGTITAVSGSDVVVRAADGTTMTWLLVSSTVIRDKGAKASASALSDGELVFAGGPVVNGTRDARLIVIRPATGKPARQAAAVS
jgi:hypothetical protein